MERYLNTLYQLRSYKVESMIFLTTSHKQTVRRTPCDAQTKYRVFIGCVRTKQGQIILGHGALDRPRQASHLLEKETRQVMSGKKGACLKKTRADSSRKRKSEN